MYRGAVLVPGTNIRHGHGEYHYQNKCFKYEGQYANGIKHGKGIMQLPNGSSYEGDFKNGEITGNGLRRWADSWAPLSICLHCLWALDEMEKSGSRTYAVHLRSE